MSGLCIIGLQWGDEAKGKLVDLLTAKQEVVVRYQGGANAGHTVVVGDQTYKLHHIPSGILNAEVLNVITGGVVLNPPTMLDEIQSLTDRDIQVKRNLKISDRAHVVMPWHLAEDRARCAGVLREWDLRQPENGIAHTLDEAVEIAGRIGYPVLGRPSYVLGGRGMELCYDEAALRVYIRQSLEASDLQNAPVLIDRFLAEATEVDVDVVADFDPNADPKPR